MDSYFSLPTDLAAEMRSWPEFRLGEGYDVRLASAHEQVAVELVPRNESEEESAFVRVRGDGEGPLFHAVLGCVAYAMSAHSDSVSISRW